MGADRPILDFPAIDVQGRSRFTVWKRSDHGRRAQENVPGLEEPLPGENGRVPTAERFQVWSESRGALRLSRLEGAGHHPDERTGTRQVLLEIQAGQGRLLYGCTQWLESPGQFFDCSTKVRRDGKAGESWGEGDPQILEREPWHGVDRHGRNVGV